MRVCGAYAHLRDVIESETVLDVERCALDLVLKAIAKTIEGWDDRNHMSKQEYMSTNYDSLEVGEDMLGVYHGE